MTKLTRVGTWIPDQDKTATIPVNEVNELGSTIWNSSDFFFMKWNGCNASTVIGTVFITVSASIEPIATMRGILNVEPRGSYEGVFRAFKQSRKKGIPL